MHPSLVSIETMYKFADLFQGGLHFLCSSLKYAFAGVAQLARAADL